MTKDFEALPELKAKDIENTEKKGWDFLFLCTDKYFEMINEKPEIIAEFNDSQHTLLAYNYLYGEVVNGGFIQLIVNGHGPYVLNEHFSERIKSWGAKNIAEITEKAIIIYEKHKDEMERKLSAEEFSALYEQIPDFDLLDDEFYEIADDETEIIKKYVEENINDFAKII